METQVRTPQAIFMQPQRLIVPLFQRPYVWSRKNGVGPLWTTFGASHGSVRSSSGRFVPPNE